MHMTANKNIFFHLQLKLVKLIATVCSLFAMFNGDNFIGSDYTQWNYVWFNPATTITSFYITARNDHVLEHDKSFIIVAYPPSLPSGHNNCYTKVTIEDRDGKLEVKLFVLHKLFKVIHSLFVL